MFFNPAVAYFVTIGKIGYKFTIFFLERNFLPSISYICKTISSVQGMFRNTFASIALAFSICIGGSGLICAQSPHPDSPLSPFSPGAPLTAAPSAISLNQPGPTVTENSIYQPALIASADSLRLPVLTAAPDSLAANVPSADDRLKSKVDSLRSILSDPSSRRRPPVQRLLAVTDSLRLRYEFSTAEEILVQASENPGYARDADGLSQTKLISDALALVRNGLGMMENCFSPIVVTRQRFALDGFFLMYPMENGAWRKTPGLQARAASPADLTSGRSSIDPYAAGVLFIPDSADAVVFSAPDSNGIWNINMSRLSSGQLSRPQPVVFSGPQPEAPANMIFPTLSPDGETLYFASDGLNGMGGYDLYFSKRDRENGGWGPAENMGFPYSSPYDDFLYIDTEDGQYSVFASNRECTPDSVFIYVLEYDATPLRHSVSDSRELRRLSALNPSRSARIIRDPDGRRPDVPDVNAYLTKVSEVRNLRDTVNLYSRQMDILRSQIADYYSDGQSADGQMSDIRDLESKLQEINSRMEKAKKELQDIQLEFLADGVLMDPVRIREDQESEPVPASAVYEFVLHSLASSPSTAD